ncbi:TIGR03943 family putative permease subunit [Paenibacillus sp. strain BS8-2]
MNMTTHLIRALLLAGFAMLIVYLFHTGDISLYIAPRMELLVKLSAIGLYAAAVYQVYAALQARMAKRKAAECDCGHHHHSSSRLKNTLVYSLFLLPLLLGFLMPTGTLGSALAAKKGISFSGNQAVSRSISNKSINPAITPQDALPEAVIDASTSKSLDELFPYDEYTIDHAALAKRLYSQEDTIEVPEHQFIETLTALDLYRDAFIGKHVQITGFVYREDNMGANRFAVSRFAMNCCSADAIPYGLMTEWPKASEYNEDEWVTVTGKLGITKYLDNDIMMLEISRIERIDAPESPYVYPDLEFGV